MVFGKSETALPWVIFQLISITGPSFHELFVWFVVLFWFIAYFWDMCAQLYDKKWSLWFAGRSLGNRCLWWENCCDSDQLWLGFFIWLHAWGICIFFIFPLSFHHNLAFFASLLFSCFKILWLRISFFTGFRKCFYCGKGQIVMLNVRLLFNWAMNH